MWISMSHLEITSFLPKYAKIFRVSIPLLFAWITQTVPGYLYRSLTEWNFSGIFRKSISVTATAYEERFYKRNSKNGPNHIFNLGSYGCGF